MAGVIYGLCTILAGVCAWLLLNAYRRSRYKLLLWGGLSFAGVTLSNAVLVVDKVLTPPSVDLSLWRYALTLVALLIFLYGLIWDTE